MKKALFIVNSFLQFGIWLLAFAFHMYLLEGVLPSVIGKAYYSSYGHAARPYLLVYYLIAAFFVSGVIYIRSRKIDDKINRSIYRVVTNCINLAIFILIYLGLISTYGFVV